VDNTEIHAWTPAEEAFVYQFIQQHGNRWHEVQAKLPYRSANAIKIHWYSVLAKRQQAFLGDTDKMMSIRQRVRDGEIVPELCLGGTRTIRF
jgi:hypothetical protein